MSFFVGGFCQLIGVLIDTLDVQLWLSSKASIVAR
jgi:hypothetical protein